MNPVKQDLVLPQIKQKQTKTFIYIEIFLLFSIGLFFSILGIALLKYLKKVEKRKMKYVWYGAFCSVGFILFSTISFNCYEHFLEKGQNTKALKNKSRKLRQVENISYNDYMWNQVSGLFGNNNKQKNTLKNKIKHLL